MASTPQSTNPTQLQQPIGFIRSILSTFLPYLTAEQTLIQPVSKASPSALVGVTTFRNSNGGAVRVFYPAASPTSLKVLENYKKTSTYRNPLSFFVAGYVQLVVRNFLPLWLCGIVDKLMQPFVDFLHPLAYAKLPRCYDDLPVKPISKNRKFPLIVWSHGLTGTSEEHGLMATTLALAGYVVAFPHHTDKSSALVDVVNPKTNEKSNIYFQPPDWKNYNKLFRQNQAEYRAKEINETRELVLNLPLLKSSLSPDNVVVGGFSFGAATAGINASSFSEKYKACILIDGWYHIEHKKYEIDINLPSQLHEAGIKIPTLFVGSAEFASYEALALATKRVQTNCKLSEIHVLEHTRHGNFMDAIYWLPVSVTKFMGMSGKGKNPHQTYSEFFGLLTAFLEKHTQ